MVKQQSRPNTKQSNWITRFVPLLGWAPHYERQWLRSDLIAGLTVTALVVPKALGYAGIASVPIQYGLYAATAGAILYAIFGTSRQISTGPNSALNAVQPARFFPQACGRRGQRANGPDPLHLRQAVVTIASIMRKNVLKGQYNEKKGRIDESILDDRRGIPRCG